MASQGEPLISIPKCALYNVSPRDNDVAVVAVGDLSIGYPAGGAGASLEARVGPVSWPLGPQVAALRYEDYTYSFTISQAQQQSGHYYCLALPPDASAEVVDLLQAVLASSCAYHNSVNIQHQPQPAAAAAAAPGVAAREAAGAAPAPTGAMPSTTNADKIAAGLQRGGQLAAAGVLAAAAALGGALHKGADAAVARLAPAEQRKELSPEAQARVEKAKSVAAQVAEVSGKAVGGVLSVTAAAAGALAQKISGSGVGRSLSNGRVAGASVQDLRKVGVAGVDAVEAVYDSLADAARLLLAHGHSAATRVVDHKYGPGAAQATGAGFSVAQSAAETGLHVMKLRPTALAKKVVKGAAKQVVLGSAASASAASGPPAGPTAAGGPGPAANGGGSGPGGLAAGPSVSSQSAPALMMQAPPPYHHQQPPPNYQPYHQPYHQPQGQPQHVAAPVAAASTLAALSQGGGAAPPPYPQPQPQYPQPQQPQQPQQPFNLPVQQSQPQPGNGVAQGVAVTGPVPGHPTAAPPPAPFPPPSAHSYSAAAAGPHMVDYTPSAAAFYAAASPAPPPPPGGIPTAAAYGNGNGLPYPAVSAEQYGARYYPAVPRT